MTDLLASLQTIQPLFERLFDFMETRTGKFMLSVGIILLATFINRVTRWQLLRHHQDFETPSSARAVWVRRRNIVWVFATLIILALWSNQITGFLFSLAAIGGALLVVSKELILCLWGALIISLNKTLTIGSTIEVGKYTGQLVNTGFLTFELAEIGPSKKQTGRLLQLPNALVFAEGIRNLSTYGSYGIHLIDFNFDKTVNLHEAEALVLKLAGEVSKNWITTAESHFSQLERNSFVDLPKARPEVFWASVDDKCLRMTLRMACPLNRRGQVEKIIVKRFWMEYLKQSNSTEANPSTESITEPSTEASTDQAAPK